MISSGNLNDSNAAIETLNDQPIDVSFDFDVAAGTLSVQSNQWYYD
jgi:hypothetical protein